MVEDVRGRVRHAERLAALEMVDGVTGDNDGRQITLGANKPVLSMSKGAVCRAVTKQATGTPAICDRPADDTPPGLCRQHADPKADRGGVRLGEFLRPAGQDPFPEPAKSPLRIYLRGWRLKSGAVPKRLETG